MGKVTAIRRQNGAESEQSRYYLLSEPRSAERFNYIVRGHWGIENRLHWVLDVTLPRGSGAEPEGALRGEPGVAAEVGVEFGAVGGEQRFNARQAEAGGLGRWLSHQHPVPIHQNPYAIALTEGTHSIDTRPSARYHIPQRARYTGSWRCPVLATRHSEVELLPSAGRKGQFRRV